MFSMTSQSARGPCQIVIFDIHALQERFYFSNNVIPRYAYMQIRPFDAGGPEISITGLLDRGVIFSPK